MADGDWSISDGRLADCGPGQDEQSDSAQNRFNDPGTDLHSDLVFVLFSVATIAGAVLFAGYALPHTVGSIIGGELFLVAGVGFIGSFLVLLAILPEPP